DLATGSALESSGALRQLAQFVEVAGLVPLGNEDDIVVAPLAEEVKALAGDLPRALEIERIIGTVRARSGAVERHAHVGDDGALAAEAAEARDALPHRAPAAPGPRHQPPL